MPTYQYACTACGQELEAVQSFSDASLTECPACAGRLRKVYGAVGVVFKGSGFYKTDSRKKESSSGEASTSNGSSGDSSSSSGSSGESSSGSAGEKSKGGQGGAEGSGRSKDGPGGGKNGSGGGKSGSGNDARSGSSKPQSKPAAKSSPAPSST